MPLLDKFNGIKIYIYNRDHRPPHIHVVYNEHEVLLVIRNEEVYAGYLPGKQFKQALRWLDENLDWPLNVFYELNPHLR